MEKPGIERAIPGAFIGLVIGIAFVPFIRWASGIEPFWDFGLAMVASPWTMMAGWLWGIGAFNPKNSEHAHPPFMHHEDEHDETAIVHADDAHHEEQPGPGAILMQETWKFLTYPILLFLVFLGFAAVPGGFFLQTANEADANVLAFGDGSVFTLPFELPFFNTSEIVINQIGMFIILVLIIVIPLALMAGGLGFAMFMGHQQAVTVAATEPTPQELTPPAPVRALGRAAKGLAKALRNGLPRFFGMR